MQIFSTNYQNTFKKQKYHAFSFSKFDNQHLFLPMNPFHTAIRRTFREHSAIFANESANITDHSAINREQLANIPRTFRANSRILANICEQSGEYSCVITANIREYWRTTCEDYIIAKQIAKKTCEKNYCFLQVHLPFSNKILSIV